VIQRWPWVLGRQRLCGMPTVSPDQDTHSTQEELHPLQCVFQVLDGVAATMVSPLTVPRCKIRATLALNVWSQAPLDWPAARGPSVLCALFLLSAKEALAKRTARRYQISSQADQPAGRRSTHLRLSPPGCRPLLSGPPLV
jgi:hypothetical protein